MPTYADIYNDRLNAQGSSLSAKPASLAGDKDEYVWDTKSSRFRYHQEWVGDDVMEYESLSDVPSSSAVSAANTMPVQKPGSLIDARQLSEEAGSLKPLQNATASLSLWVLDTNTLIMNLELLKALFASLLTRNVAYACDRSHRSSCRLRLVVPYVVITELDGLKKSSKRDEYRRSVSSLARSANTWLLSALQKQKRVFVDQNGSLLPDTLRPLFVQPSTHFRASRKSSLEALSNDEEIIRFCMVLKSQIQESAGVYFCSDDTNARTRAELDGIDSLGVVELAKPVKSRFTHIPSIEERVMHVADTLLDQWEYQLGEAPLANQYLSAVPYAEAERLEDVSIPDIEPPLPADVDESSTKDTTPEEQPTPMQSHAPLSEALPVPAKAFLSHRRIRKANSAENMGRNIRDSIHAPKAMPTPGAASVQRQKISSTLSPTPSELLNPQIDWADLIRHARRR